MHDEYLKLNGHFLLEELATMRDAALQSPFANENNADVFGISEDIALLISNAALHAVTNEGNDPTQYTERESFNVALSTYVVRNIRDHMADAYQRYLFF